MRRKTVIRVLLLAAAVSLVMTAGWYLLSDHGEDAAPAAPVWFTEVSYARSAQTADEKTDIRQCVVTLAYLEFTVDGSYHTPKVTVISRGKKLRKNSDYKVVFYGGKKAGTSKVKVTGIGQYTGEVTKIYKGIERKTTAAKATRATTRAARPPAPEKTPAVSSVRETAAGTTAAPENSPGSKPQPLRPTAPAVTAAPAKVSQSISSISAYTFPDTGKSKAVGARASSGLRLSYQSSAPGIVSVNQSGIMRAKKGGTARITIKQSGNERYRAAARTITVSVPSFRSREDALTSWRHLLIDTFFHINGRKYSYGAPGKYWKDAHGKWSGKTGKNGHTQSCVTLSTVTLKRTGLLSPKSGCVWLNKNKGKKPNKTVRRIARNSVRLSISYPHKSLKYLAAHDMVRYGDILCRSGHTFIYMGKDAGGHPLIYESGTRRDIGNRTCVVWGHHAGGHADKLTGKINKQIRRSDAIGDRWKKGELRDDAFRGHRAKGKNLNKPVHIICSIRTFKVRTCCVNGTITPGNIYMAGKNVTIKFNPLSGKTIDYVKVDGKKVRAKTKYTFRNIGADHTITVQFKQKKRG